MHKCLRKATKRKILFSYTEKIIYMHIITDEEKKIVYFFLHIFNIITTLIRTIILDGDLLIRPFSNGDWARNAKDQTYVRNGKLFKGRSFNLKFKSNINT